MKVSSIATALVLFLLVVQITAMAWGQAPGNGSFPSPDNASLGTDDHAIGTSGTTTGLDLNIFGITIFKVARIGETGNQVYEFFPSARVTLGPTISFTIFDMELGLVGLIVTVIVYVAVILQTIVILTKVVRGLFNNAGGRLSKYLKRQVMRGKAHINHALGKSYKGGALAASDGHGAAREIKNDVFISYSSSNKNVADQICMNLESKGIKCWMAPRDIRAGDTYQEAIINAIDASSIMVFVFSSVSNDSPHVIRELNRAVSLRVTLIPFRIENVPLSKAMEYLIGVPHWMDAYEPPLEDHIDRLATSVKSILKGKGRGR